MAESQEKAFTYFNSLLSQTFIAIVDDWNWDAVKIGTRNAFQTLGYEVLLSTNSLQASVVIPRNGGTAFTSQ